MNEIKVGRIEQLTHTPGPWKTDDGHFVKAGARIVAETFTLPTPHLPSSANARLIAVAPELYDVAKLLLDAHATMASQHLDLWQRLSEAIAKAEGR